MYTFPSLKITYKWAPNLNMQLIVVEKNDLPPRTFSRLDIELSSYLTELNFSNGTDKVSIFDDGFVYLYLLTDLNHKSWIINLGWDNLLKTTAITPKIAQKISVRLKKVKEYMEFVTANQVFTVHI